MSPQSPAYELVFAAIREHACWQVVEALRGMPEDNRRALHERLRKLTAAIDGFDRDGAAVGIAAAATAPDAATAARLIDTLVHDHDSEDALAAALADRKPYWLPELADRLLPVDHWDASWHVVRGLVRAGLVDKPADPGYVLHMVRRLGTDVLGRLRDDPDLLEDEVFRLFTVPGCGRALREWDRLQDGRTTWRSALVLLAAEGALDRRRLLAACLDALLRGFPDADTGWYVGLHRALEPAPGERRPLAAAYRRLAAEGPPAAAALAREALAGAEPVPGA